jgi:UDP-N-acetylmuramyl pentapeptide phosphotransferase/UDP-N-acetylglucosamine-1-phosphate transferase
MYGFMGIHELPPAASIVFTMLTIVVITNSFNLIDGVDGLAGSLGLLTSLVFGAYFAFNAAILLMRSLLFLWQVVSLAFLSIIFRQLKFSWEIPDPFYWD